VSAYFTAPAAPILCFADAAAMRAEPSARLRSGQLASLLTTTAYLPRYDEAETAADDGVDYWKPDDVDPGDPGRWVRFPVGGGSSGPDFTDPVLHVNAGGAVPSTGLYGLSVDFTAGANRRGIFWDAANARWAAAQDTLGDDATISSYLDLRVAGALVEHVENAAGGSAASGLVRMASGDEVKARLGASTYRMLAALGSGDPTVAIGETALHTATVDAATLLQLTSQGAAELRASTTLRVKDPTGGTTLLDASVSGSYLDVFGRLRAKNGGSTVLDVDVGSSQLDANGKVNINDPTGAANYFSVSTGTTTAKGTFKAEDASGAVTVFEVAGASSTATLLGRLIVKDAAGAAVYLDVQPSGPSMSFAGLVDVVYAGIGTTQTRGRQLRNTTASTAGVTVQRSPIEMYEAHARVSGADRTFYGEFELVPKTSGNMDLVWYYNNAGTRQTAFYYTTATPSQYAAALVCSAFSCTSSTGGFQYDFNGSGMYFTWPGGTRLVSYATTDPLYVEAGATGSTDPVRLWANGETKGAAKKIVVFGDGTTWAERSNVRGDGSWDGPLWVVSATPKTANYTAVVRDLVFLDPTGGAFDFTLPTAVGCGGKAIRAYMTAVSANVVTLRTSSGQTISGSASGTLTLGNALTLEVGDFVSDNANWWFARHAV